MSASRRRRDAGTTDGFIIIPVLWILGALATLAVIYSYYSREAALEFINHNERLEARSLAVSGVELAAYQLTAQPDVRPIAGTFSFRQGTATVRVDFHSENSRVDLNFAPNVMLASLFTNLGATAEDATNYADRIIGWRTPLVAGARDSEAPLYEAAGKSYGPRHGPFQDPSEVGLVVGIPPSLVYRLLPYLTVYSGQPEINVLGAAPQVLAALPGLTPDLMKVLLTMRANVSQDVLRAQVGTATSFITLQSGIADSVQVDVDFASGRRSRSEAVILVADKDTEPYRVLSWHDDVPLRDRSAEVGLR
jgi:general secretion pathway protein K